MKISFERFDRQRAPVAALVLLSVYACGSTTDGDSVVAVGSAVIAAKHHSRGSIDWKPCELEELRDGGAVCGTLEVPLDYGDPRGQQIKLALAMVEHSVPDAEYQGIMLSNPGGPGASGLSMAVIGQYVPNAVGLAYDWVGFDPRGVGASEPRLTCSDEIYAGPLPLAIPTTRELERDWLGRAEAYATACGERAGELLEHMRTSDVARDMDRIRAALQASEINYYGFSYGTYLGQVYATLFPARVRKMVLDSNVDPSRAWYRALLDQDVPLQRNVEAWWAWVAQHDDTYHFGATADEVERAWYAEQARLGDAPAGGVIGPTEWTKIFGAAGAVEFLWPPLADLWLAWARDRDPQPLLDWSNADSGDDNEFAVFNAVTCVDAVWPARWSRWRSDTWAAFRDAPFIAWSNTWFSSACLFWPSAASPAVEVRGADVAPILLLGETEDGATPFSGNLEVRRRFPNARLIATSGGRTHAGSLNGNLCVDDQIAQYLADGSLPARVDGDEPDALCDPLPPPEPEPASLVASGGQGTVLRAVRRLWNHRPSR